MAQQSGKVKVFISWSGDLSKAVAHEFRVFLPRVIQSLEPWVSAEDISTGSLWHTAIMTSLRESRIGIIVLTEENVSRPWLHYEAGFLSHYIEQDQGGLVSPLLVNTPTASIQGPMTSLQAATFDKPSVLKLLRDINRALPEELDGDVLNDSFEYAWPKLAKDVDAALKAHRTQATQKRPFDQERVLTEILDTVRLIARSSSSLDSREIRQTLGDALDKIEGRNLARDPATWAKMRDEIYAIGAGRGLSEKVIEDVAASVFQGKLTLPAARFALVGLASEYERTRTNESHVSPDDQAT